MKTIETIIVGNGEAALICALSVMKAYPEKKAAILSSEEFSFDPNLIYDADSFNHNSLWLLRGAIKNRIDNKIILESSEVIKFEKLILATGCRPIVPEISGIELEGVNFVVKDSDRLRQIRDKSLQAENIVIYGGGYIGVEFCDELLRLGKNVTIVEKSKRLLPSSFYSEISNSVQKALEDQGGKVQIGIKIKSVVGIDSVTGVLLKDNSVIDCDFFLICCGSRPNVEVAEKLGLIYDRDRGIFVDEYFHTSSKDIYAVGECTARNDFFNGDFSRLLMLSSRFEEAHILGSNLYSLIYNRGKIIDYLSNRNKINEITGVAECINHSVYPSLVQ